MAKWDRVTLECGLSGTVSDEFDPKPSPNKVMAASSCTLTMLCRLKVFDVKDVFFGRWP